jgi:hypothetical protein
MCRLCGALKRNVIEHGELGEILQEKEQETKILGEF